MNDFHEGSLLQVSLCRLAYSLSETSTRTLQNGRICRFLKKPNLGIEKIPSKNRAECHFLAGSKARQGGFYGRESSAFLFFGKLKKNIKDSSSKIR
jgi:hypothetical protein